MLVLSHGPSINRLPFTKQQRLHLLDTQVIIPIQSVECNHILVPDEYHKLMSEEWTRLIVRRGDSLDSVFLNACRHLSRVQPNQRQHYKQLALQYKASSLQKLNKDFSMEVDRASTISEETIATVMMLACDEVSMPAGFFNPQFLLITGYQFVAEVRRS